MREASRVWAQDNLMRLSIAGLKFKLSAMCIFLCMSTETQSLLILDNHSMQTNGESGLNKYVLVRTTSSHKALITRRELLGNILTLLAHSFHHEIHPQRRGAEQRRLPSSLDVLRACSEPSGTILVIPRPSITPGKAYIYIT